jgi:hypothetical protein
MTFNEWETTLALGSFTNGTHPRNIEVEFEWSFSVGYTSLEPYIYSREVVMNNTANVWLNRLQHLNNIPPNNRNRNRIFNFNYEMYDKAQFRIRFRLTKDGFREILNIIGPAISGLIERGNPCGHKAFVDITLLCNLYFSWHVETSVTNLNRLQVELLNEHLRQLLP